MSADEERTVTEGMVRELAELAELELGEERLARIADQLDGLLADANRVNRFMAKRREVGPGVRFDHPDLGDEER